MGGLPFTMIPRILYRGYPANLVNLSSVTCFQFGANGFIKKLFTGGVIRPLSPAEEVGAGFLAGASSALLCSPMELVMIQQQNKGGNIPTAVANLAKGGHFARGFVSCALREGIFT